VRIDGAVCVWRSGGSRSQSGRINLHFAILNGHFAIPVVCRTPPELRILCRRGEGAGAGYPDRRAPFPEGPVAV